MAQHKVQPSDITHVVCTHGHSDHTGCNYLFQDAELHIVGYTASNRDRYSTLPEDTYDLDENVSILKTPGHTLDSVSVIVENCSLTPNRLAICGDLFEREEDCFDKSIWLEAGSEAPSLQLRHRLAVAEMSDVIVPGHGPQFEVTEEILEALRACRLDNGDDDDDEEEVEDVPVP